MAREKTKYIDMEVRSGAFAALFRTFGLTKEHKDIQLKGVAALRRLLSNERAKMLHVLKTENPTSIYHLAKLLKRDFKSVRKDVELLKNFDLVRFVKEAKGKRKRLKPVLNLDVLHIKLKI